MKTKTRLGVFACAAFALCAAFPAFGATGHAPDSGLQLAVESESVRAGEPVKLRWEIVPDSLSSSSIVLGLIMPNGAIMIYEGPRAGFTPLHTIESAGAIADEFPFNTAMKGMLEIVLPPGCPGGTCQFIAAVRDGKTILEIDYSNSFRVE